jgi:hypothetical protein
MLADGADKKITPLGCAGLSMQIERASPSCGSDSASDFWAYAFDERLLVGNGLVHYIIGDDGFSCVHAIAHPRGRRDRDSGRYVVRSFKMAKRPSHRFYLSCEYCKLEKNPQKGLNNRE